AFPGHGRERAAEREKRARARRHPPSRSASSYRAVSTFLPRSSGALAELTTRVLRSEPAGIAFGEVVLRTMSIHEKAPDVVRGATRRSRSAIGARARSSRVAAVHGARRGTTRASSSTLGRSRAAGRAVFAITA